MHQTLLIYSSRYGLTETIIKTLALVLGPARYCRASNYTPDSHPADFIVLGIPIYGHQPDPEMLTFVKEHQEWLKTKRIALICIALAPEFTPNYLQPIAQLLGEAVVWKGGLGGRIISERLSPEDYDSISRLASNHTPLPAFDRFDPETVTEIALQIKSCKDRPTNAMPVGQLREQLETFLKTHNTAALATAIGTRVRSTPIEYTYHEGSLYLLSEGGTKFANLLLNPRVSISVFEPYKGMTHLYGVQMEGLASIVELNSEEYNRVLKLKGLNPQKIAAFPSSLNLIRIALIQAEFLNSEFKALGYDVKQNYTFTTEPA